MRHKLLEDRSIAVLKAASLFRVRANQKSSRLVAESDFEAITAARSMPQLAVEVDCPSGGFSTVINRITVPRGSRQKCDAALIRELVG